MRSDRAKVMGVTVVALVLAGAWGIARDADELLEAARAAWRGETFQATVTLDVTRGGETTVYRLELWAQGETHALVRILAPEEDAGSGYLLVDDELWYYAPVLGRPLSLPPIALGEGLLGSGLDLEDVLRGTTADSYEVAFAPAQPVEGYGLVLTPVPGAAIVYGRLELVLRIDLALQEIVYYDQRGRVVKRARVPEFLELPDRVVPRTIVVEEASGDRTVQTFERLVIDEPLDPALFTLESLVGR